MRMWTVLRRASTSLPHRNPGFREMWTEKAGLQCDFSLKKKNAYIETHSKEDARARVCFFFAFLSARTLECFSSGEDKKAIDAGPIADIIISR